jgi:hypothetical protein
LGVCWWLLVAVIGKGPPGFGHRVLLSLLDRPQIIFFPGFTTWDWWRGTFGDNLDLDPNEESVLLECMYWTGSSRSIHCVCTVFLGCELFQPLATFRFYYDSRRTTLSLFQTDSLLSSTLLHILRMWDSRRSLGFF